jgi:tRNA G46 methylase TrmB
MEINDTLGTQFKTPGASPDFVTAAGHSKPIRSSQQGIHPRLGRLLDTHVASEWRQPPHPPTVAAFESLERLLDGRTSGLILDSGCGTGESTRRLGAHHPGAVVLGVDKSAVRLAAVCGGEGIGQRENVIWVRAELASFWRLAVAAGWLLDAHYLLYPNPWPKPGQLQRRWHAHPVFPTMLRLGGRLEMHCNWLTYAEEFAFSINKVLDAQVAPERLGSNAVETPFERKYRASGHSLYSVSVSVDSSFVK